MIENLLSVMDSAVCSLKKEEQKEIRLFHHNDTDGISSGTILTSAFEEIDYKVGRFSIEKPYPQVLEKVFTESGGIIFFADFAGRIAPMISEMNQGRNLVIILDHHPAEAVIDDRVFVIDGELFALKGDRDISASATCYLFAERLLSSFGKNGKQYAHLGALGAIGDGFFVDGALSGINRSVMESAVEHKSARIVSETSGESYFIRLGGKEYSAEELCDMLDTAGGVGYYSNGVSIGIEICRNGISQRNRSFIEDLRRTKDKIFAREIVEIKHNLHTTEHLQWFDVKNRFQPMGVKMIGVFCTCIKDMDFLDKTKYLAGFQYITDNVPGFGKIEFNATKISMRVSSYLTEKIRSGEILGLSTFLGEATKKLGGFTDACHSLSAATSIEIGKEKQLIREIEQIIDAEEEKRERR
ncbi:MAG: hypothetical protein K9L75_04720 [Spirochaetia bacterium]|nr:hypothetical protein [Spirochaetia bacterium]